MWITGDRRARGTGERIGSVSRAVPRAIPAVARPAAGGSGQFSNFEEWRAAMAGSVNKVILVGNLGKDPEIRRTQDGRPIANLSVATSETWRDKATGERKEKTEWHRVVIFSEPLCKIVEQYLKKGAKVYIEGALQTRKWTDQAGVEKYSTEVVLQGFNSTLTMLDGRSGAGGGGSFGPDDSGGDFGSSGPSSAAPRRAVARRRRPQQRHGRRYSVLSSLSAGLCRPQCAGAAAPFCAAIRHSRLRRRGPGGASWPDSRAGSGIANKLDSGKIDVNTHYIDLPVMSRRGFGCRLRRCSTPPPKSSFTPSRRWRPSCSAWFSSPRPRARCRTGRSDGSGWC